MYYTLHCECFQLFRGSGTPFHSSQRRGRKGLRSCGFTRFLVRFAEIYILSCGIAVLQYQAVYGI